MSSKVFVVLPVFNRLAFTKKCLLGVSHQSYKNIEVIVVDDGSTDGTFEYIRRHYPQTHIIQGDGNWWWGKAMCLGIEFAMSGASAHDYILFLNNDCYIGPGYLRQLVKTASKYPKSIIGSFCVTTSRPVKVVEAGVRIDWPTGTVYSVAGAISSDPSYYKKMAIIDRLDALPGKGTLVPVSAISEAGNINYKKLPHYIADYEFFIRAQRAGYRLLVDVNARVRHVWEATGYRVDPSNKPLGLKQIWVTLFSRKSMNNIVDWINFLLLACPKKYLYLNLRIIFWRLVGGITRIYPFIYLKGTLTFIRSPWYYTKLFLRRRFLNIVQFPKYHLKRK